MIHPPRRYARAALAALALLLPAVAGASVVRHATVEALAERADAVLRGRVTEVEVRRVDEGRRIVTLVTVEATEVFKGDGEAVQIVVDGGLHGELGQKVHGLPELSEGDDLFLFLEAHPAPSPPGVPRRYGLASMGLGAFRVEAARAVRQVDGLKVITGPLDAPRPLALDERVLPLVELEARVRAALLRPGTEGRETP